MHKARDSIAEIDRYWGDVGIGFAAFGVIISRHLRECITEPFVERDPLHNGCQMITMKGISNSTAS